ncbi:uncharacterized protein TEOVI_000395300 [Trypanosoma equiperdum]|uniref:Uncharacterized protein n=1 Tax=Trypanosoma equiperdum TaxID=5694 RepID=A0A1G4IJ68_TRYEQ|nr:hypothetical protein, conserved [Trypanosoma equiperdum]
MGENDNAQQLVEEINGNLIEWTTGGDSERLIFRLLDLYNRFMVAVHRDLVSCGDQGPALATAVCIPLWEMLHLYSGPLGPFRASSKAFAITLLTSLYPKTRDRRCLYQQLGCICSLGHPPVPLSWCLPMSTEVVEHVTGDGSAEDSYEAVVGYVRNTVSAEGNIIRASSSSVLNEKVGMLLEDVLPRCYLVVEESATACKEISYENAIIITIGANERSPSRSLCVLKPVIWKYLVLLHVYSPEDARSLGNYVTNSSWAQRTVRVSAQCEATYASLIGPIVHEAAVCTSLIGSNANAAPDNTPFLCPRLLGTLLPTGCRKGGLVDGYGNLTTPFKPNKIMRRGETVYQNVAASLHSALTESIPMELSFFNASSSCRDCDKLTLMCRSAMLTSVTQNSSIKGLPASVVGRMLFDRKRGRDDVYEGPMFLPSTSTLSDLLGEDEENKMYCTLERIAATHHPV